MSAQESANMCGLEGQGFKSYMHSAGLEILNISKEQDVGTALATFTKGYQGRSKTIRPGPWSMAVVFDGARFLLAHIR